MVTEMKKFVAPDQISMLAAAIHDLTYPSHDHKNNTVLTDSTRMRAVKNTVAYSFGHKSGSDLAYNLRFSVQKNESADFKKEIQTVYEKLCDALKERFGISDSNLLILKSGKIELRVQRHPSGRYNLEYRSKDSGFHRQLMGVFIGNQTPRDFYQSAFRLYHFLMRAGYDVDFKDMVKLEGLNSVLIELDLDTRMKLRGWIYRDYNKELEPIIREEVDKKIQDTFVKMGLIYQANFFGDFGETFMPMSLFAEGVLIPEVYFTPQSLKEYRLQPYH